MRSPRPLPTDLGPHFSVVAARAAGVNEGRLRRGDLARPFHGIRADPAEADPIVRTPYERQAAERLLRAAHYAPRLRPGQFLSHETAAAILGGPLPLETVGGRAVDGRSLPVHVSTIGTGPLVRTAGVTAHRADPRVARVVRIDDLSVGDPATTWAQLGHWNVSDLVALGDYFCRVWRPGPGRPDAGRPPLATTRDLSAQLVHGRRRGIRRLRAALDLIREDSWSPRESALRCLIVMAGMPEPLLNQDVYDEAGRFVGCVDLAYPDVRTAIEYHGIMHSAQYAADVERSAALRAAGWDVIEVTNDLFHRSDELLSRIRRSLRR